MRNPLTIICGDALTELRKLPEGSVQCCVTSPPYWGLRDYGVEGQLGLEKSPGEYVDKLVAIFREVRRVLREDGTLWLNLGDSYAASGRGGGGGSFQDGKKISTANSRRAPVNGLKSKDLVGIPWRVAFALQEDGWYLRCDIVWHKPNPMPESCMDRPTKSHEYIFLLTKSEHYFYDMEAIKERTTGPASPRMSQKAMQEILTNRANGMRPLESPKAKPNGPNSRMALARTPNGNEHKPNPSTWNVAAASSLKTSCSLPVTARNKRSVWTVASASYAEAHFATFPPDLIRPCIQAGTSARGACAGCGATWRRIVEDGAPDLDHQRACGGDGNGEYHGTATKDYASAKCQDPSATKARILAGMVEKKTVGWEPTCKCGVGDVVPCLVLDPFFGSGTTGLVSLEEGRNCIGLELNPEYCRLAARRTDVTQGLPL